MHDPYHIQIWTRLPTPILRLVLTAPSIPLRSILLLLSAFVLASAHLRAYEIPVAAPKPFTYPGDTFAFKNETKWNYVGGAVQPESRDSHLRDYTGRCMVLSRASVQFWKFARFDPHAPPIDDTELARRIREICARDVWRPALSPRDRIVLPYRDLHEASAERRFVFQRNIGFGWPFYFRAGNIVIASWVSRGIEARLNSEIFHDLALNTPTIIWAYRFPSLKMNHVIVVYSGHRDATGYHYLVYDTNYHDAPKHLDFNPATRTFAFEPVYYFKGGPVTVRSIYRGLTE
jgi:hypothetical protein